MTAENYCLLDRDVLYRLARVHKVTSVLSSSLKRLGNDYFTPLIERLQVDAKRERAMRQFLLAEWRRIASAFRENGLPMITFKGPALSIQLYGAPTIREFVDLDIAVECDDFAVVCRVMNSIGYYAADSIPFSAVTRAWYVNKPHHAIFNSRSSPMRVEVHSRCLEQDSSGDCFRNVETIENGGERLLVPERTEHGIIVIMHGSKHLWLQLHWLRDLYALFTREDTGFLAALHERIMQLGIERHAALGLILLRSLDGSFEIPRLYQPLVGSLERKLQRQAAYVREKIYSLPQTHPSIAAILGQRLKYAVPMERSLRNKWRILITPFLVSPIDMQQISLPTGLQWLHLVLRPWFVIRRRIQRRVQREGAKACK